MLIFFKLSRNFVVAARLLASILLICILIMHTFCLTI